MRGVLSGQVVFLFRRQFFLLIESIPPGQPADQGADARYEEPEHSDNQSNHSENNVAEARFYKAGRVFRCIRVKFDLDGLTHRD